MISRDPRELKLGVIIRVEQNTTINFNNNSTSLESGSHHLADSELSSSQAQLVRKKAPNSSRLVPEEVSLWDQELIPTMTPRRHP